MFGRLNALERRIVLCLVHGQGPAGQDGHAAGTGPFRKPARHAAPPRIDPDATGGSLKDHAARIAVNHEAARYRMPGARP